MSTGAFTLADVDKPAPTQQTGQFTANDIDSGFSQATSIKAPPKVFSSDWFKEKADRASDYLGAAGAGIGGLIGLATAGPPGAIGGAALGGGAGEAGRQLVQRALGTNYNVPQAHGDLSGSGQAALQIGKEAAIQGALTAGTEGLAYAGRAIAPAVAESSLGVNAAMRGRGRTIGEAVLNQTSGIGPKAVSESAAARVDQLTGQMEQAIDQATQRGQVASSVPAHQVIDNAIRNTPRNAKDLINKLQGLRDSLDLRDSNAIGPMQTDFTPNDLLEMKRGIGKMIDTWPPEWKYNKDMIRTKMQIYGALDKELDRVAPGTDVLNQQISSLIPAIKQGAKEADQAGLAQNLAHRLGVHTGALIGASAGAAGGYQKGGAPGAVLGGALGLIGPEVLASPQAQMLGARTLFNAPKAAVPLSALGGGLADYLRKPKREGDAQ